MSVAKLAAAAAVVIAAVSFVTTFDGWSAGRGTANQGGRTAPVADEHQPSSVVRSSSDGAFGNGTRVAIELGEDAERAPDATYSTTYSATILVVDTTQTRLQLIGDEAVALIRNQNSVTRRVVLESGMWSGQLGGQFSVLAVEVGGRPVRVIESGLLSKASPDLTVTVEVDSTWTLDALDSVTGDHLRSVQVRLLGQADDWLDFEAASPPDSALNAFESNRPSPLELADDGKSVVFWVRAPGYAWKKELRVPGQHLVRCRLVPAATLAVTLMKVSPPGVVVEVLVDGELPREDHVQRGTTLLLADFGAANYSITIRAWSPLGAGAILAAKSVSLGPGDDVEEIFDVEALAFQSRRARLDVSITIDPSKASRNLWGITLHHRDGPSDAWTWIGGDGLPSWIPLDSGRTFQRFFDDLQEGDYLLEISPIGLFEPIHLTAGQEAQVVFDCSRSAALQLRPLGPEGQPVASRVDFRWEYVDTLAGKGVPMNACIHTGKRGGLIRCLPRRIRVVASCEGWQPLEFELSPEPGESTEVEVVFVTRMQLTADLSVWRGGSRTALPEATWMGLSAEGVGHEGQLIRTEYFQPPGRVGALDFTRVSLLFDRPGSYRVRFPELPPGIGAVVPEVLVDVGDKRRSYAIILEDG